VRLELRGVDYLDYWLQCIHSFTASYSVPAAAAAAAAAAASSTGATVGPLSPAVFVIGTNRSSLHDDPDQQLKMASLQLFV